MQKGDELPLMRLREAKDVFAVDRQCIERFFQVEWLFLEGWMVGERAERLESNRPFADARVALCMSTARFFAIVQVHGQKLVEADRLVELGEHSIKIVHDVVAGRNKGL